MQHALDNSQDGTFCGNDGRGRHESVNKTKEEDRQRVKGHIESFPSLESHYCRMNSSKRFLDATLNVSRMYRMYTDLCAKDGVVPVSSSMYRNIFDNEYNLSFHKPKTDQCLLCYQHDEAKQNNTLTETLKQDYEEHQHRKRESRAEKEKDKALAQEDVNLEVVTFDMQAVLSTPCNQVSQTYYKHKLAVYNLTVYSLASKDGKCFVWDETHGHKGSCEIATCLLRHLKALPQVKHAVLYSDTCSGQNRNKFVSVGLLYAAQHLPNLQIIDQKFVESGHTHMECDSMHSTIESAKRNCKVQIPDQWKTVMECARPKQAYVVEELEFSDVLDFKAVATSCLCNSKTDGEGSRINWMKIKWLRYLKGEEDTIYFKYRMSDPFRQLKIRHGSSRRGRGPVTVTTIGEIPHRYTERIPLSAVKKADLLDLCRLNIIQEKHHHLYRSLPCDSHARDRLPEPDINEDMDTDED
ncbi:hypothetical protein V1264_009019 [Littorina saxatilis]|uniref:DUF7869 domain-containing protein n=1 Tax=Littorina saxatilis TaxID=31220 RepID=A0AAN9G1D5_9CAEN